MPVDYSFDLGLQKVTFDRSSHNPTRTHGMGTIILVVETARKGFWLPKYQIRLSRLLPPLSWYALIFIEKNFHEYDIDSIKNWIPI